MEIQEEKGVFEEYNHPENRGVQPINNTFDESYQEIPINGTSNEPDNGVALKPLSEILVLGSCAEASMARAIEEHPDYDPPVDQINYPRFWAGL